MIEIPKFGELSFEELKHVYTLNGITIPSVTTIMNPLSAQLYQNIDETVLSNAAKRGTEVHQAIDNYTEFGVEDVPPEYKGYFNAWLKWKNDFVPEIIANECKMYHKYLKYAGTADAVCYIDGKLILVDYKTSASINHMLTGVQLEAYSRGYESHGIKFDEKAILHLRRDGSYTMERYKAKDTECWEVFGSLLNIFSYVNKF